MSQSKPWYASVGVWGAVVSLVGSALSLLKVQVDPAVLDDLREWLLAAASLAGAGVALYGRLRASRRIGAAPPPPSPSPPPPPPPNSSSPGGATRVVLLLALLLPATIPLGGCAAPSDAYVAADRATFDAVAPEYAAYVAADPLLGPAERERRGRTLEAWLARIGAARSTGR
jgi:hypothetical protein